MIVLTNRALAEAGRAEAGVATEAEEEDGFLTMMMTIPFQAVTTRFVLLVNRVT